MISVHVLSAIVAVVAVSSFAAGVALAYWLQFYSARQEPDPPLRVGAFAHATLNLRGDCEVGQNLAHVDPRGTFIIEVLGIEGRAS